MDKLTAEGLAGIRLLFCMARADGVLRADERFALEDALAGVKLPDGISVEQLENETNSPADLAAQITSAESRDFTYASVYALAHCDRHLHEAEERILKELRAAWKIEGKDDQALAQALDAGQRAVPESGATVINDPGKRREAFEKLLTRYALLTAVTGAIPVPLVPDLLVVPMQVKMIYDVAALFGHKSDRQTVQLMLETLGVGTGVRIAVSVICKFVPVWGSVVGGASAYATTYALAKVAYVFYEGGGKQPIESLKPVFRAEQEKGKKEFEQHRAAVAEAEKQHGETLKKLAFELQSGKISQKEYEQRVDSLA
ncbi:MAG TPA: hypothetical protein VEK08_19740 [Planctomycetota bacterium]|nr:hypothetical protein [Planctomycetota bacterium]